MSIEFTKGKTFPDDGQMYIECDQCGNDEEYIGTFRECIKQAKDDGWIILNKDEEYIHLCSNSCKNKFKVRYK